MLINSLVPLMYILPEKSYSWLKHTLRSFHACIHAGENYCSSHCSTQMLPFQAGFLTTVPLSVTFYSTLVLLITLTIKYIIYLLDCLPPIKIQN